jgi:hypothetical protein
MYCSVAYESLQALLPYPLDRKANAVLRSEEDISKVRARRALRTLLDANSNMGLLVRKNCASSFAASPGG